jgi:enterobactin synthetase component D
VGRLAADDALAQLGAANRIVGRGERGQPLWPDGYVGTISHTAELAIAVAAQAHGLRGIGVDLERLTRGVSDRAARLVCLPSEEAWAQTQAPRDDAPESSAARRVMLFSAKEAVFKALYPIDRVWLGYSDAELTWMPPIRAFRAVLRKAAAGDLPAGTELLVRTHLTLDLVISATHA